jgi:hypothetical protein
MKTLTLIFLLIAVYFINSCKVECPCFDKSLLTWMPYDVGDVLTYVNQQNDTLSFTVKSKILSEEYKEKKRFEDECVSDAVFHLSDDFSTIAYSQYYFTIDYDESGITIKYNIELLISDNVYCSGLGSSNIECCLDTITINGEYYNETIIIERDTINYSDEIWKVIVANNYGIIRFYDRETDYVWTLVDE